MIVDFIEIGTSDFNTLIQKADDNTVGFSIEPLDFYLDRLPNKKNVQKINCAISASDEDTYVDIYYVPIEVIEKNRLPYWLKGCSSVNSMHPDPAAQKFKHLYVKKQVKSVSLLNFIKEHDITQIKILKIDVEGLDCKILNYYFDALDIKPEEIIFEHKHSNIDEYKEVTEKALAAGYKVTRQRVDTKLKL